jgi:hypothetical protein
MNLLFTEYTILLVKRKNDDVPRRTWLTAFDAVPGRGLEPPRIAAQVPKTCVYTNFTTPAKESIYYSKVLIVHLGGVLKGHLGNVLDQILIYKF